MLPADLATPAGLIAGVADVELFESSVIDAGPSLSGDGPVALGTSAISLLEIKGRM